MNQNFNLDLYLERTDPTENFIFKEEIIEYITENIILDGDSSYSPGYRSMDYYEPDDQGECYLECEGKLSIEILSNKFGKFTSYDLENLQSELYNNTNFINAIKDYLRDIKVSQITDFDIDDKTILVTEKEINISFEAGDFEIDS